MQEAGTNYVKGFGSRPFSSKDNSIWDYVNLDNLALLRSFNPINLVQVAVQPHHHHHPHHHFALTLIDAPHPSLPQTHNERLKTFFNSQKLRDIFSFQDLYVGLAPHTAPGIFSLLQHLEIVEGVWYPVGGFSKVRDGLVKSIAALGVKIRSVSSSTTRPVAQFSRA